MSTSTDFSPVGTVAGLDGLQARLGRAVRSVAAQTSAWIKTCADHYAAAAIYEQLSKLSDAELHQRGLSRATLASEIPRTYDGTNV